MCDTLVIRRNGRVFFAKNSDREPGEAQLAVRLPAVSNDKAKKLSATYIQIDQAANRHGVLLSKPFWMWGAEMGANDKGVVIGNEAVFTRVIEKTPGLIGMDLVRLGLERGDTAEHAMHVITELLETYGQGGVCGYRDKHFRYDNSFIIADARDAWVLETAGRHWAAKRVADSAAISNCLTITTDYDRTSAGIEDFARSRRLYTGRGAFDFRAAFETAVLTFFSRSRKRLNASSCAIRELEDKDPLRQLSDVMDMLRIHQDPKGVPSAGSNADICMHADGPIRRSQTCGSMVSQLGGDRETHLFTGTSAPCMSVFKPVAFEEDRSFYALNPDESTVEGSLWQQFEPVHRHAVLSDEFRKELRRSAKDAEQEMLSNLERHWMAPDDTSHLSKADHAVRQWTQRQIEACRSKPFRYPVSPHGWFWKRMNRADGFDGR